MSDFNLGTVTAYGYAKDKGYTGTEDEYAELMASYADVAEQAAESATQAAASATTATAKASEAAQSATAAASSKTAAQTAKTGAETAAQTATTKAGEASTSATTASNKATEATTAATTATGKATEAAGSATTATTKAGEASTSATNAAASATRAQEILDSIPADYSQLSEDVDTLKDGFQDLCLIKSTSFDESIFKLRKGARLNTSGKYASDSLWIAGYGSADCPYVYAGTKITANTGYKFSYSLWNVPVSASAATSERIAMELNIPSGTTITIPQDGYIGFSCAYADGSALPSDINVYEFANEAVEVELYIRTVKSEVEELVSTVGDLSGKIYRYASPDDVSYSLGNISAAGGIVTYKNCVMTSIIPCKIGDIISCDSGYITKAVLYSAPEAVTANFIKTITWTTDGITIDTDGYMVVVISDTTNYNNNSYVLPDTSYSEHLHIGIKQSAFDAVDEVEKDLEEKRTYGNLTDLYRAQKAVATDWHLPFVDVYNALALGNNHQIPATKGIWDVSGTKDLTQKDIWMSDGTHPYRGVGLVDMYARTVANQFEVFTPSYHDEAGESTPTYWAGKTLLWLGTSIPAGSDPIAGDGTGATYPALVATQLGATTINKARGSSCLRVNASNGEYTNMHFNHFLRSILRTVAECDAIAADWSNIYQKISGAPSTLSAENLQIMKNSSFESFFLPYLDGTNDMPDCFVIDYGHNDVRPHGIDGKPDLWVQPTADNIKSGLLADDSYMTANNYANLKLALNDDLSGISNLSEFSASVNRYCLQGAFNFLITLILRYNPYARIVLISDYN